MLSPVRAAFWILCSLCCSAHGAVLDADERAALVDVSNDTVVSAQYVDDVSAQTDALFTREQVCEDYEIALHLLALVQAPQGRQGSNVSDSQLQRALADCPGTFTTVAKALGKRVADLHDFHTVFSPGLALGRGAFPTITGCEGLTFCQDLVGSSFRSLASESADADGERLYGFVARNRDAFHAFEIESMNSFGRKELMREIIASQRLSLTRAGNSTQIAFGLLYRSMLDGLTREDLTINVRDLQSGVRGVLRTSYEVQAQFPVPKFLAKLGETLSVARNYGCVDVEPGSTDPTSGIGACRTVSGRAVLWMSTLSVGAALGPANPHPVDQIRNLVRRYPDLLQRPILIDVRGNTGGNPYIAMDFVCTFGDDTAIRVMKKRRLLASFWPEKIQLSSGREITPDQLAYLGNSDLVRVSPGWTVSSHTPTSERRGYEVGFWERNSTNESQCMAMRDAKFSKAKWILLTDGREFSATENLLDFLKGSLSRFRILGNSTWGGTGAPVLLTLPNTRMQLRLSVARHVDGSAGGSARAFPIEGVGVSPHGFLLRELPIEFEKRLYTASADDGGDSQKAIPYIVRNALAFRF